MSFEFLLHANKFWEKHLGNLTSGQRCVIQWMQLPLICSWENNDYQLCHCTGHHFHRELPRLIYTEKLTLKFIPSKVSIIMYMECTREYKLYSRKYSLECFLFQFSNLRLLRKMIKCRDVEKSTYKLYLCKINTNQICMQTYEAKQKTKILEAM